MQRPPLVVVQDATHCRTIIEHDILGAGVGLARVGLWRLAWELGKSGQLRGAPFGEHLPFDRPQPPYLAPHLYLGAAVGVEHGLGDIPHEVIGTIAVRDTWKL